MIKVGLTGGIGSGKSVIATLFRLMDIPVYIADEESKRLTVTSPVIRQQLTHQFGREVYTPEGLNKPFLAQKIFTDPDNLEIVNGIIHPEVAKDYIHWTQNQHSDLCVIEAAILFESGFDQFVDHTVMVYTPLQTRIKRIIQRDHSNREDILRRIENQLPDEIKKERSDYVIYNDDLKALIPQTEKLLNQIRFTK
ncbi:MAG: dephospho-CoA kinase [Tannerellaceae bacterium]|nr:dephospho-CoA kinase [Tannerellaceae bacterium]